MKKLIITAMLIGFMNQGAFGSESEFNNLKAEVILKSKEVLENEELALLLHKGFELHQELYVQKDQLLNTDPQAISVIQDLYGINNGQDVEDYKNIIAQRIEAHKFVQEKYKERFNQHKAAWRMLHRDEIVRKFAPLAEDDEHSQYIEQTRKENDKNFRF